MASGVDVSGVQARPRRGHAVAVRNRRADATVRRLGDSPWRRQDLLKLAILHAIGLVVIVASWVGSSGAVEFDTQTRWTAFAALGAALASIGGASWLLAGLAAVSRERRLLRQQIAVLYAPEAETGETSESEFVTADGMRRYHRASCDVVRGKATRPIARPRAEDLAPCGMCQS